MHTLTLNIGLRTSLNHFNEETGRALFPRMGEFNKEYFLQYKGE